MSAERIALWWVDRYTRGLSDDVRTERRAEIASDLWEHRAACGDGAATRWGIVSRCVRGVPADVSWRRSQAKARRALPSRAALFRGAGWAIAGTAYALLVAWHAFFATALAGFDLYGSDWSPGDVEHWSRVCGALLALLVGGAFALRRAPRLGASALTTASVASAAVMWWMLPLTGPVALAVSSAAVILARRRHRALRQARAISATS